MGINGSPEMMPPAARGASDTCALEAELGAATLPAPRSPEDAVLTVDGVEEVEGAEGVEGLEGLEGLGGVAHPVSHAVTTTRKRGVIFMSRESGKQ